MSISVAKFNKLNPGDRVVFKVATTRDCKRVTRCIRWIKHDSVGVCYIGNYDFILHRWEIDGFIKKKDWDQSQREKFFDQCMELHNQGKPALAVKRWRKKYPKTGFSEALLVLRRKKQP